MVFAVLIHAVKIASPSLSSFSLLKTDKNAVSYIEREHKSKSSQYISSYCDRVIKFFIDQVS